MAGKIILCYNVVRKALSGKKLRAEMGRGKVYAGYKKNKSADYSQSIYDRGFRASIKTRGMLFFRLPVVPSAPSKKMIRKELN